MRTIWSTARRVLAGLAAIAALAASSAFAADDVHPPVSQRFAPADVQETPDFQRHVSPLFGRLGCNSRSCHGSFQGRGGFQLSLFGYDFQLDHDAMLKGDSPRVNVKEPLESLIVKKPTDADLHEGGLRYKTGGWEYNIFRRWIEAGAKFEAKDVQKLTRLEITPAEILFSKTGETVKLKAVAVWPDGSREDVTPICRFTSNSDQVATIDENGLVTATDPGDTHVVVYYDNAVVPVPVIRPVTALVGAKYPKTPTPTKIDELVVQKLAKLGVVQSDVAGDAEFLRRVSLDLTGTLPTAAEVEAFLGNPSPNKRSEKVEELLASPAYAAWWTTLLCDFTGNNDGQLNNILPVQGMVGQQWYDWIYKRVADNMPYDELAAGIVLGQSRAPSESYTDFCNAMGKTVGGEPKASFADRPTLPYYWARNNFRLPEDRAIGFAYTFLGIRIQCAQCHKHPFDQWSKADFDAFKAFFTRVQTGQTGARDKETVAEYEKILADSGLDKSLRGNDLRRKLPEVLKAGKTIPFSEVYVVKPAAAPANRNREKVPAKANPRNIPAAASARVLGGEDLNLNEHEDARTPLMAWLRDKDNPYFARAFVNRVWANYFNVGIVQPPDDMSLANPPSNKPLLDYLAQGFIEHKFDMKWLHREIIASRTYQLSWQSNETNAKDERNFARSVPRRLPAEVAYDALMTATLSDEKAASMRTNLVGRAISVPASSARQNNGAGAAFALQVFGRSIRESNCDCDRSMEASLLQTVYLQNDQQVLSQLSGGRDTWVDQISQRQGRLADGGDPSKLDLERELARTKFRLDRAKKERNKEQVANLEGRLKEIEKALTNAKEVKANPGGLTLDSLAVIRQAYLRTLSRPPTAEEIERCEGYLTSAENPQDGAKGLLWALVNSKEFIVNH